MTSKIENRHEGTMTMVHFFTPHDICAMLDFDQKKFFTIALAKIVLEDILHFLLNNYSKNSNGDIVGVHF